MAIATKQVASGILAAAIPANYTPPIAYIPVSNSSDWFESFAAEPENATMVSVAVSVESAITPGAGSEVLTLSLLESKDLKEWSFVTTMALTSPQVPPPTMTIVGLYYATYSYGGGTKKYLRLQFNVDDPAQAGTNQTLPQPPAQIQYDGTCWVTVA